MMNNLFIRNAARFLGLVLAQALFLKNVNLFGYVNPLIYPMFILLLPFNMQRWQLLVLGFFTGLSVDLFTGTYGMHAAAATLIAFIRPFLITVITSGKSELDVEPNIRIQGTGWFILYVSIACLFHHLCYFFVEIGTFYNPFYTIAKALLSTLASTLIIILLEIIFRRAKKRSFG